jgi:hypothetical protein
VTWLSSVKSAIAAHAFLYTGIAAAVVGIVGGALADITWGARPPRQQRGGRQQHTRQQHRSKRHGREQRDATAQPARDRHAQPGRGHHSCTQLGARPDQG